MPNEVTKPTEQVSLFQFGGLEAAPETTHLFERVAVVDKKTGAQVGDTWKMAKARDARTALKLSSKGDRDEFMHRQADGKVAAFKRVKSMILAMDDSAVGLERLQIKQDKNGLAEFTMRAKQLPKGLLRKALTIEKIAEGFGITIEEAKAKMDAVDAKRASSVNVESTVVRETAPTETEGTGMSDDELERLTAPQPGDEQPAELETAESE